MEVKKIAVVSSLACGMCVGVLAVIINKKIKQAHADGWFSGFAEASRDYEKEIRAIRKGINNDESPELV